MNNMRKVLCFLMAMMFAAFAVPGIAVTPDKIFGVTATPLALPAGETTTVTVVFKNESPGNSTINSLKITAPAGATITKVVSLTSGASSPAVGVLTSVATVSVANMTSLKSSNQAGFTLVLWVSVPAGTPCSSANWLGQAFTGNSYGGDAFGPVSPGANTPPAAVGCDGILNCGDTVGNLVPALDGTPDSGIHRGPNAGTGGPTCAAIPYSFDFDPTGKTSSFIAVKGAQNPSVEYVLAWAPIPIPAGGWTELRPNVSWGTVNNPPLKNTNDYVPALACLSGDLSQPDSIMPIIPNVAPFDAASSPQPQYLYDGTKKAKICIADQGWVSVGGGLIQYWDRVIDQSDGWVDLP